MDYSTDFIGTIHIEPPLNQTEINYLTKFSWTRHMKRQQGQYFIVDGITHNENEENIISENEPHTTQPSLWCDFEPSKDGTSIEWNGSEKTACGKEWIKYLIDHFLKPKAKTHNVASPYFKDFTYNHVCNGELIAQGEDPEDHWKIIVKNNVVSVKKGKIVYDD